MMRKEGIGVRQLSRYGLFRQGRPVAGKESTGNLKDDHKDYNENAWEDERNRKESDRITGRLSIHSSSLKGLRLEMLGANGSELLMRCPEPRALS
jgi:hypothetical protein